MGISNLLPFVSKATRPSTIKEEVPRGGTVAVDGLCWLHRGAYGCATQLALGEKTDGYITYCVRYVRMLRSHNLNVIVVFDGASLPLKSGTENKRRQERQKNKALALKNQQDGNAAAAAVYFQRCIEITAEMKLRTIQALRKIPGVDCLVAPYEADAQLAFLSIAGLADLIVTQDSDLILFGAKKIMFKMDANGNGDVFELAELPRALGQSSEEFSLSKFRRMCILSGCDYLDSLPGIGLAKAAKFFAKTINTNLRRILPKIPSYLRMNVRVPASYIEEFERAERCFIHQVVFDPATRTRCHLNPLPNGLHPNDVAFAGDLMSTDAAVAVDVALGNVNPNRLNERLDDFDPQAPFPATGQIALSLQSIWRVGDRVASKPKRAGSAFSQSPVKRRRIKSSILNGGQIAGRSPKIGAMSIEQELIMLYGRDISSKAMRGGCHADFVPDSQAPDLLSSRYFSSTADASDNLDQPCFSGASRREENCNVNGSILGCFSSESHRGEDLGAREAVHETSCKGTPTERLTRGLLSKRSRSDEANFTELAEKKSHIDRFDRSLAKRDDSAYFKTPGNPVSAHSNLNSSIPRRNPFAAVKSPAATAGSSAAEAKKHSPNEVADSQAIVRTPPKRRVKDVEREISQEISRIKSHAAKAQTVLSRPSPGSGSRSKNPGTFVVPISLEKVEKEPVANSVDDEVSPSLLQPLPYRAGSLTPKPEWDEVNFVPPTSVDEKRTPSKIRADDRRRVRNIFPSRLDSDDPSGCTRAGSSEDSKSGRSPRNYDLIDLSESPVKKLPESFEKKGSKGAKPTGKCKRPGLSKRPSASPSPNQPGIADLWSRFAFKPKA